MPFGNKCMRDRGWRQPLHHQMRHPRREPLSNRRQDADTNQIASDAGDIPDMDRRAPTARTPAPPHPPAGSRHRRPAGAGSPTPSAARSRSEAGRSIPRRSRKASVAIALAWGSDRDSTAARSLPRELVLRRIDRQRPPVPGERDVGLVPVHARGDQHVRRIDGGTLATCGWWPHSHATRRRRSRA